MAQTVQIEVMINTAMEAIISYIFKSDTNLFF